MGILRKVTVKRLSSISEVNGYEEINEIKQLEMKGGQIIDTECCTDTCIVSERDTMDIDPMARFRDSTSGGGGNGCDSISFMADTLSLGSDTTVVKKTTHSNSINLSGGYNQSTGYNAKISYTHTITNDSNKNKTTFGGSVNYNQKTGWGVELTGGFNFH